MTYTHGQRVQVIAGIHQGKSGKISAIYGPTVHMDNRLYDVRLSDGECLRAVSEDRLIGLMPPINERILAKEYGI